MKNILFLSAISFFILSAFSACFSSSNKNTDANNASGFAVVELFTSEGCSSCPPADDAVAKILQEYKSNVYVLGYHVDYWDKYGWRDIFSNADYTMRQKNYAKALKLPTIYTPQVVVNGEEQLVGSDKVKMQNAINNVLKQPAPAKLSVNALAMDDREIMVSYKTNAMGSLNVALIQLHAENKIGSGENHGATLHHINIVRDIKTIPLNAAEGKAVFTLPDGLSPEDCAVIAFTQNNDSLKITSAARADISK